MFVQLFGNILLPPVLKCLHACALGIDSLDPLQTLFDFDLSTLWLMYCLIHRVPYLLWHKPHTSTYLVKELILRYLSLDSGDAAWNRIDSINLFPELFDCMLGHSPCYASLAHLSTHPHGYSIIKFWCKSFHTLTHLFAYLPIYSFG